MSRFLISRILKWLAFAVLGATMLTGLALVALEVSRSLPPHRYHPLGIYYEAIGLPVHPFLPVEGDRQVSLEVWSADWPVRRSQELSYAESIRNIVYELQRAYPGVSMKYRLFPLEEDLPSRVLESIKTSELPDIYIGPFTPDLLAGQRSIALTAFWGRNARPTCDTIALAYVTMDRDVWAWPIWIEIPGLVGNKTLLGKLGADIAGILTAGWTWEEFMQLARKASAMSGAAAARGQENGGRGSDGIYGLVINEGDPTWFEYLLSARSPAMLVKGDGTPGLDRQGLLDVAGFLEELRKDHIVPPPEMRASHRMLELFWQGKAMTIGPAWPGLVRHARERSIKSPSGPVRPVLLPFPRHPASPYSVPVRVYAGYIYRQPADDWRERARLAADALARIARDANTIWLMARLGVVPADLGERYYWQDEARLSYEENAFIAYSTRVPATPAATRCQRELYNKMLAGVITPALREFWDGRVSREQLMEMIERGARDLLYPCDNASH